MGDSDDDYDKRRGRDKFRRDRSSKDYDNDYDRSRDKNDSDKNRNSWTNGGNSRSSRSDRNRSESSRQRYSPNRSRDYSPSTKRSRHDTWGDDSPMQHPPQQSMQVVPPPLMQQQMDPFMPGGPPHHHPHWQQPMPHEPIFHMGPGQVGGQGIMPGNQGTMYSNQHQNSNHDDTTGHTVIMTFKQFIMNESDDITDETGVNKFRSYKNGVRSKQICEFFSQHKDEEWFRVKYQPGESLTRENELRRALQRRKNVYQQLRQLGLMENMSFDLSQATSLERILNSAVVLLEGGDQHDLDIIETEIRAEQLARDKRLEAAEKLKNMKILKLEQEEQQKKENKLNSCDSNNTSSGAGGDLSGTAKPRKLSKRTRSEMEDESISGHSSDSEDDDESRKNDKEPVSDIGEPGEEDDKDEGIDTDLKEESEVTNGDDKDASKTEDIEKNVCSDDSKLLELEDGAADKNGSKDEDLADKAEAEEDKIDSEISILHKTQSIFLRNLSPDITKREVESMCKKFPGYKRVAIQDPQADRKFYRRGWVTFDSNVNIKEICLSLTNIRLRECEMGAIINRELKQRIRPVSGIVSHKTIAVQDLKNAIKIINNYDNKWKIWNPEDLKPPKPDNDLVEGEQPPAGTADDKAADNAENEVILEEYDIDVPQTNELVVEATKFLETIDESQPEEEDVVMMANDSELIMHLDKLLMYLRLVYSFDYFAAVEYPNEDEMPNRCGILHARATLPVNKLNRSDIKEWISSFELRINPFINMSNKIDEEDAIKLGKKDKKSEVEKFIKVNSEELDKGKWLCQLSGKKFKGPDFIRKHIFTKHAEKVLVVRSDVEYFNNFLMDINRPGLPEMAPQGGRTSTFRNQQVNPNFNQRRSQPMQPPQRNPMMRQFQTPRGDMWRPRMDRRMDSRPIICYNDLDAPMD